jgi:hypothetical protein
VDNEQLISAQRIKDTYLGKLTVQKNGRKLSEILKLHEEIYGRVLRPGTLKNYRATEKYLKDFIKSKFKTDDIPLVQVDYEFATEFEAFIPGHPIKDYDKCNLNGAAKHIERLKKLIKWARKLTWIKNNPIADYYPSTKKYKRLNLQMATGQKALAQ